MDGYYEILRKYWGYADFRPAQLDVICSVGAGRDTLALMPTGAGKSLLYQVPALAADGVCIVVTPLVALMKDQTDRLRSLGMRAAALHSGLATRRIDLILDDAAWGDLKFLYVAPERIASQTFRARLRGMNVCLLAVDEAHCISQWGYDFRPSYLRIAELREMLPDTPVLALTASATPAVAEDIMRHLRMADGRIIRSSFARANLSFAVRRTDDKQGQLLRVLNNVAGAAIVYVRTREGAERLCEWLVEDGVGSDFYHGGLGHADRTLRQERWMRGERRVMVATNAFGMGIDRADVRLVLHYDIPDSLEAYYQEAGRAGRDGRRAYAVLLTAADDRARAVKRFETEYPPLEKIRDCYEALHNYLQIGIGDGQFASFDFNIHDFARYARMFTGTALNAIKILQQNGYVELSGERDNPPRIMFCVGRDDLYRIRIERDELDHIIRTLLRLYTGVFHGRLVAVDIGEIASASGYTTVRVQELLKQLWQMRVIRYVPGSRSPVLTLMEDRLPTSDVFISPESYRMRKEMSVERLKGMFAYADGDDGCRSALIQSYFGEHGAADCGVCDLCLARRRGGGSGKNTPDGGTRADDCAAMRGGTPVACGGGGSDSALCTESDADCFSADSAEKQSAWTANAVPAASGTGHVRGRIPNFAPNAPSNTSVSDGANIAPRYPLPFKEGRDVADEVLSMLRGGAMSVKQLVGKFLCDPVRVTSAIDRLAAAGQVHTRPDGKIEVKR